MSILILTLALLVSNGAATVSAPTALPVAEDVLARTIAHHDPEGTWASRPIEFASEVRYGERIAAARGFAGHTERLNGASEIGADDLETYRLSEERLPFWRDYFTFLYGLPMKLRDPGTRLHPRTPSRLTDRSTYRT